MARDALAGTRIREKRVVAGIKQADLAREVGISASYLNLIEHNRRRIGGKLLLAIARVLDVDPVILSEGAETALVASLREAAARAGLPEAEAKRAEEFAGRFPGWADALAAAQRRIAGLERTVETLSDRLAHDPDLAASVHEVLSTAASIRATASILAEDPDLAPDWQRRFHANLDADSQRLAASSKTLVGFLDAETGEADSGFSAQEEVEAMLGALDFAVAPEADIDALIAAAPDLTTAPARRLARTVLGRLRADAQALPDQTLKDALDAHGLAPLALAAETSADLPRVLRRLSQVRAADLGLVVSDRAGSLVFRKSVAGFVLPRHGAACPLWPLFEAFQRPGSLLQARVEMPGRAPVLFECYAYADLGRPAHLNAAPLLEATMLIVPVSQPDTGRGRAAVASGPAPLPLGPSCRICPRKGCTGRREPSILSEGF